MPQTSNQSANKLTGQITGAILGGAAGDALGYPVEFYSALEIQHIFGQQGIQNYEKDPETNKALVSDDTQMTLFTINGILNYDSYVRYIHPKKTNFLQEELEYSYLTWLKTQTEDTPSQVSFDGSLSLRTNALMYHQRNPGRTCLSALKTRKNQKPPRRWNFEKHPINNSMGNGGLMRVAPITLYHATDTTYAQQIAEETRQTVMITHGNPDAWIPAIYYNLLLWWIIRQDKYPITAADLQNGIRTTGEILRTLYPKYKKKSGYTASSD